ncbi:hypothetical protein CRUP_028934, partial [Coryphaenoides rupestris]
PVPQRARQRGARHHQPVVGAGGIQRGQADSAPDSQHICGVHGAPRDTAPGQQRQGDARLAVRLQPSAGRNHQV